MLKTIHLKIEKWLYCKGFQVVEVRRLACNQIGIAVCGMPSLLLGPEGFDFFAGVLIGTMNFLALAKIIQELVYLQKGGVGLNLFSFYGRLVLTAALFYALLVLKGSSVLFLLLGISTVVLNILLWGMSQILGKTSKEA